jgi:hypothetical protein
VSRKILVALGLCVIIGHIAWNPWEVNPSPTSGEGESVTVVVPVVALASHRFRPPSRRDPHDTSPAPTATGCPEDRCSVVSNRPLLSRAAAKMSPHISIGPEPDLTVHAPSPPAAGSHCQAKEDSAPDCGTEFYLSSLMANPSRDMLCARCASRSQVCQPCKRGFHFAQVHLRDKVV